MLMTHCNHCRHAAPDGACKVGLCAVKRAEYHARGLSMLLPRWQGVLAPVYEEAMPSAVGE